MLEGSFKRHAKLAVPSYAILIVLIVIALFFSEYFRTMSNYYSIINQCAALVIIALGETLVILGGGIDLSVGNALALTTCILATYQERYGFGTMLILVLLLGGLIGLVNGVGVTKLGIPPMIMTMSTQFICRGISLIIRPTAGGSIPSGVYKLFDIAFGPISMMLLAVIMAVVIMFWLIHLNRFGRNVYAAGGNQTAAAQSGINVSRTVIMTYVFSSIFAVYGGIITTIRMSSGDALAGDTYALDAITAVVVGGTLMDGGIGGVAGTVAGAVLIAMIPNFLNLLGLNPMYRYLLKGILLIVALGVKVKKRR